MRPSPASCDYATLPWCFATDIATNYAVPGRAKSNAPCVQTMSGTGCNALQCIMRDRSAAGRRTGANLRDRAADFARWVAAPTAPSDRERLRGASSRTRGSNNPRKSAIFTKHSCD